MKCPHGFKYESVLQGNLHRHAQGGWISILEGVQKSGGVVSSEESKRSMLAISIGPHTLL
jgi:hypothetical protein